MTVVHLVIGAGEGVITVAVLLFLGAVRPDLLHFSHHLTPSEGTS